MPNGTLIPFYLLSAAVAVALCLLLSLHGWAFVGMLVVFFLAAFAALWVLMALGLSLIALFIDKKKPQLRYEPFYPACVNYVLGLLLAMSRIRVHVSGMEQLPAGRFLLVCNHRSNYDPIAIGWALRKTELAFVSKPSNLRIPMVGAFLHKSCYLAIDRENDREALKTILAAIDLVRRDVVSVAIFPEGTRHAAEEMLPFRNGAFKVAQRGGCPVVVCAIRGTDTVHHRAPWHHTDVYLDILTVLDADAVRRMKTNEIGELARTCMTSALSNAS